MQTRSITNAAMTLKPLGIFIKTGVPTSYRTVSINTPANTWKSPEYRGAMIANKIATSVESLGRQFMADLWPERSTIDL